MEGFKGMFQGGNCSQQMQGQTQNQFKNFMQNMNNTSQQINKFQQVNPNMALNNAFQNFDLAWSQSNPQKNMQMNPQLQNIWNVQQKSQQIQQRQQVQKPQAPMWNQFVIPPSYPGQQMMKKKQEQKIQLENQQEKEQNMQANNELIELMQSDPDPKFQESEFLKYLKNIRSGRYELKDNKLIVNESIKEDQTIQEEQIQQPYQDYVEYLKSEMMRDANMEQMLQQNEQFNDQVEENDYEQYIEEKEKLKEFDQQKQNIQDMWKEVIDNYDEKDPDMQHKLEEIWKESIRNYEMFGDDEFLSEAWQAAGDLDELQYQNFTKEYKFKENNPYKNLQNPLTQIKQILVAGALPQLVQVLEAHIQKNPTDYNAWRSLGLTLQEMNQDQQSVSCFLQSIQHKPDDVQSLLQLGVSCTNIFDEINAMNFLERWAQMQYKDSCPDKLISEQRMKEDNWKIDEINKINIQMIEKFESIKQSQQSSDPNILYALGILYYINRNFKNALNCFELVSKLDPENYFVWNKLGAMHAMLKDIDSAKKCYHKVLELKPNYIRGWANLGINYNTNKQYNEAKVFFLNSIALNPSAKHLWSYLQATLTSLNDKEGLIKMKDFNLNNFAQDHNIKSYQDLPQPKGMTYQGKFERFQLQEKLEDWVQKYEK